MVPRLLRLYPLTYRRLIPISKEAEQEGAYRVAKRLQAVVLNSEGRTSGDLARILKAPRSKVSEWLARYQAHGVEGLLEGYRSGRPPRMTETQHRRLGEILDSGPVAYGLDTCRLDAIDPGRPVPVEKHDAVGIADGICLENCLHGLLSRCR